MQVLRSAGGCKQVLKLKLEATCRCCIHQVLQLQGGLGGPRGAGNQSRLGVERAGTGRKRQVLGGLGPAALQLPGPDAIAVSLHMHAHRKGSAP